MILADEIRKHVIDTYFFPTKERGHKFVVVRSIDVHKKMELDNRMPAVCDAIDAKKFIYQKGWKLLARIGKKHDWGAEWVFKVE